VAIARQWLDVPDPPDRVEAAWPYFVEWLLVGHERLICTQLACVDAWMTGQVSVQGLKTGGSRIVFTVDDEDFREEGTSAEQVRETVCGYLRHDLAVFKEYLESGYLMSSRSARQREKAGSRRRQHISQAPASTEATQSGHVNPVRPSNRA